jgi:O-antigen ligase
VNDTADAQRATVPSAIWVIVGAAIASTALVFSMDVSNFLHAKEAMLAVLLVPCAVFCARHVSGLSTGLRAFAPLFALVLLQLAASLVPGYAHVPEALHREAVRMLVLLLFAAMVLVRLREEAARAFVTNALLVTATIAGALAFVQRGGWALWLFPEFVDSPDPLYSVFGNSGLLGGYMAIAIPLAVHRALRVRTAVLPWIAAAVCVPVLIMSGSRGGMLGAIAGTALILPYRELPIRRAIAFAAICAFTVIAPRLVPGEFGTGSWTSPEKVDTIRLRFWFWDGALRMAADHPLFGVGLGNFSYWSPAYQGDALRGAFGARHIFNEAHTQYAHNEPLHLLAETGLIGMVLCGWTFARLVRCRGPEWGGLAAGLIFGLVHFPLHSAPHALAIVLLAAMLMARRLDAEMPPRFNWMVYAGTTLATLAIAVFVIWDVLMPSVALRRAVTAGGDEQTRLAACEAATEAGRFHPDAHAYFANVLLGQENLDRAETRLRKALEGLDTGDLHLALGYVALQRGDRATAEQHLRAAVHRWPANRSAWAYLAEAVPAPERDAVEAASRKWLDGDAAD